MAKKIISATKLVIPCRISFANIFEPKSINGSEAKYSVSCLIPKDDKKTLLAIHKAVEAAKEDGKVRKWGGMLEAGISTEGCLAVLALRMRVSRSAIGSVICICH